MNKRITILIALLFAIMLSIFPSVCAEKPENTAQAIYVLPHSLQLIDEEAFAGTPVELVILPDSFLRINANAFSSAMYLTDVFIPESTEYVDDTAFLACQNLVIHGVKGSYAEDWAKKHKVAFVEENIWKLVLDNSKTVSVNKLAIDSLYRTVNPDRIIKIVSRAEDEDESKRPQDRPELNPIDYRFP